jgi:hypothetical protein
VPLKYLCLRGLEDIFFLLRILCRHGPTLRGLIIEPIDRRFVSDGEGTGYYGWIYPFFDHDQLQNLAARCPFLEDLRVPIRRSFGTRQEVRAYEALGTFLDLRNLVLDLVGNPRPVSAEGVYSQSNEGNSRQVSFECVLINSATDEKLVTAIWRVIFSRQESKKLTKLRVLHIGLDAFKREDFYVLWQLCRSFLANHCGVQRLESARDRKTDTKNTGRGLNN